MLFRRPVTRERSISTAYVCSLFIFLAITAHVNTLNYCFMVIAAVTSGYLRRCELRTPIGHYSNQESTFCNTCTTAKMVARPKAISAYLRRVSAAIVRDWKGTIIISTVAVILGALIFNNWSKGFTTNDKVMYSTMIYIIFSGG